MRTPGEAARGWARDQGSGGRPRKVQTLSRLREEKAGLVCPLKRTGNGPRLCAHTLPRLSWKARV